VSGSHPNVQRRIARWLAAHAAGVLPKQRKNFAAAMRTEIEHVQHDRQALIWALGCVVASYLERINDMTFGTLRVSRWVLGLEMIMCFWWLTWMFLALASRGLYFGFAGPLPMDPWFFTMLTVCAVGPIGSFVAFRSVVLGRRLLGRVTTVVLCVAAAWTCLAFLGEILNRGGWLAGRPGAQAEALGLFVLFALLPALGVAHLVYLSRAESRKALAA
jgi:hypothetical protein